MSQQGYQYDLIILVADKSMEVSLKGILKNHERLGIRPLPEQKCKILSGLQDAGCFKRCEDFLRPYSKEYQFALVMLDREGSGKEHFSRVEIEADIERRLANSGWAERAKAIVFDPELEIWVWSNSPKVDEVLGWNQELILRDWLRANGWLNENEIKPVRPKEALEAVLRVIKKPWSSAIHFQLAQQISFQRCEDKSFLKLKNLLKEWFPKE